jgi:serine/threonine protein kinase
MMNRSCLLRTLQRPRAGLRKSARRSVSANNAAEAVSQQHTSAVAVAAAAAAGLTSGGLCSDEANDVNREIAILKKLDHPNVVKLFEVIDPPGSQYMMLVMEFLEKGPVLQTHNQSGFDSLPEEVAADFFRQAVLGLEYLHFHKVGWGYTHSLTSCQAACSNTYVHLQPPAAASGWSTVEWGATGSNVRDCTCARCGVCSGGAW